MRELSDEEARDYVGKWLGNGLPRSVYSGITHKGYAAFDDGWRVADASSYAELGRKLYALDHPKPEEVDVVEWARGEGHTVVASVCPERGYFGVMLICEECDTILVCGDWFRVKHAAETDFLFRMDKSRYCDGGKRFTFKTDPWGEK